ncbi:hypothetical protein BKH41_01925 [Helicobacter sp. 12S02232-10]|uniref:Rha family transcriptional regulator n=1 Tax=Helicobacter sp. 12S02232-10 TaxID=1476197 RepID=UPI000BA4FDFA|nr:Rha family transcriptional regulator [Helicobacter sp. 12S02232-10]PAF49446.1 hypothetical protein BKH41_01925 [Helicobacter sp. 12S02232-10]
MADNIVIINNKEIDFQIKEFKAFISSNDVAEVFGKRHDNIIAQIKNLPDDNFSALNFKGVTYKDAKGEIRPAYNLTRDGFSLLVMGFTGSKAYQWKIAFIDAFNKIEFQLRNQLLDSLPAKEKEIADLSQKVRLLEAKIDLLQNEKFGLKDEIINIQRDFIASIGGKTKMKTFAKINQYGHITQSERQDILNYYKKGCKLKDIADLLQKNPVSIKKIIDEENLTQKDIEICKQQLAGK